MREGLNTWQVNGRVVGDVFVKRVLCLGNVSRMFFVCAIEF